MQFQGNLLVAPDREEAIYRRLKKLAPNNIITPSYLRMEKLLSSGQSVYSFDIGEGVNNPRVTERRLNLNDAFMATHIGIYLLNASATLPGGRPLATFPSYKIFPAEANNVETEDLECLYNGFLRVKVADVVYAESMATRKFRYVPTTQDEETDPPTVLSGVSGLDGLWPLTPQFTFQGQAKNQLELHVPCNSTQQVQYVTSTDRIYAVWYMEGFLITQGSALGSQLR